MHILYVGQLETGGTCLMRLCALKELGHDITSLELSPKYVLNPAKQIWTRIRHKIGWPSDLGRVNAAICNACSQPFDLIWLDKSLCVWPRTLDYVRRKQPRALIIGYSVDDMAARHNQSRYFIRSLPFYDVYFTTKTYNVSELREMGAPSVKFTGNAYDIHTHRPMDLTTHDLQKYRADVGFVGTFERDRAEQMRYLATHDIPVRIYGNDWHRFGSDHPNLVIHYTAPLGHEYSKAICAASINLCFLRKINRDQQTQRSVEIPACGGFMLAERTEEHLALFAEGTEAEYFGSPEELVDKVRFYLGNSSARRRIAEKGRARCIRSGYSYHERLQSIVRETEQLREP